MNTVPHPLVSVILPTWNRLEFLKEAVQSVLDQTEPNWELLIADDGSTDGTGEYLASLTDPRIRVLRSAHIGHPGTVRNVAIREARGRYVAYLDSDDLWDAPKLERQLTALAADSAAGWCYTNLRRIDQERRPLPPSPFIAFEGMVAEPYLAGQTLIITSTIMAERALILELGGFDDSLPVASDFDLWMRLAERSAAVGVDEVLVTRRRHPGNYGGQHRENLAAVEEVFRRVVGRARTPAMRRIALERRARWLARLADQARQEGRVADARRALRSALPHGLLEPSWWRSSARALFAGVLPGR